MWMGEWNTELSRLYDIYYQKFGIEPDCYEVDLTKYNCNEFAKLIKKCIISNKNIPEAISSDRKDKYYDK